MVVLSVETDLAAVFAHGGHDALGAIAMVFAVFGGGREFLGAFEVDFPSVIVAAFDGEEALFLFDGQRYEALFILFDVVGRVDGVIQKIGEDREDINFVKVVKSFRVGDDGHGDMALIQVDGFVGQDDVKRVAVGLEGVVVDAEGILDLQKLIDVLIMLVLGQKADLLSEVMAFDINRLDVFLDHLIRMELVLVITLFLRSAHSLHLIGDIAP